MLTFLGDFRYSLRALSKAPGFSIVALLVLALGIGANTAIFSVVNSVVLRPLPYPGADRLALIWETDLKDGIKREGPSGPNFLDWKEQNQSFEEMSLLEVGTDTLRKRFSLGLSQTRWLPTAGSAPPALPVFTVPAGSKSITSTSCSANGRCSVPRGTITNSPSATSSDRSAPPSSL